MQYPLRKFLLKPGLPILQLHRKDTAAVFWIFGLMVFKEHLFVIQHAEDFNFAGFVRHCIAHTLAEAIALSPWPDPRFLRLPQAAPETAFSHE